MKFIQSLGPVLDLPALAPILHVMEGMSATLTGANQVWLACVHFVQASIRSGRAGWRSAQPGRDRSLGRREVAKTHEKS